MKQLWGALVEIMMAAVLAVSLATAFAGGNGGGEQLW